MNGGFVFYIPKCLDDRLPIFFFRKEPSCRLPIDVPIPGASFKRIFFALRPEEFDAGIIGFNF
jgi:hypothetical protein